MTGVMLIDRGRPNWRSNRVLVCRLRDTPTVGDGKPWLVHCPCCHSGATFSRWHRALYWAVGHVYITHPQPATAIGPQRPRYRVLVFKNGADSDIRLTTGLSWTAYCPNCRWNDSFSTHAYALHEALMHIACSHWIDPVTGTEVPL